MAKLKIRNNTCPVCGAAKLKRTGRKAYAVGYEYRKCPECSSVFFVDKEAKTGVVTR